MNHTTNTIDAPPFESAISAKLSGEIAELTAQLAIANYALEAERRNSRRAETVAALSGQLAHAACNPDK